MFFSSSFINLTPQNFEICLKIRSGTRSAISRSVSRKTDTGVRAGITAVAEFFFSRTFVYIRAEIIFFFFVIHFF